MGGHQSKDNGGGGLSSKGSGAAGVGSNNAEAVLQTLPSISKSDTKESSLSFRALRSKMPGSNSRTDSPRNSAAFTTDNVSDKGDAASIRSHRSSMSRASRTDMSSAASVVSRDSPVSPGDADSTLLPPTPTISPSVVRKSHANIDAATVDAVSDYPPVAGSGLNTHLQLPGPSILLKSSDSFMSTNGVAAAQSKSNSAKPRPLVAAHSNNKPAAVVTTPVPAPVLPVAAEAISGVAMSEIKDIDLDDFIKRLHDAGYSGKLTKSVCLKNAEIQAICLRAQECFLSQPALLELDAPVKVVGDVHGQYTDLLRLFEMCGFPPSANYLFLGDYVDRGKQSLETILLLLCYKIKFPHNFFLLRGNHECANITRVYGFYDECKRRCNVKIWKGFVDCFNTLPIAAIIASKIFTVHGGLSPALTHMDDIRNIARPTDVPDYGLLNDLLWSDPFEMESDWGSNERGVSYCFNKKVIADFLAANDFDLVCRAHMVVEDGYEFFTDRLLVTVFSAPNYCGEFDNWGAVMSVSSELLCSFELLKPLDSSALKGHIKKGRSKRLSMANSPPASVQAQSV